MSPKARDSEPQTRPVIIVDGNRLVRQGLRRIVGDMFPTVEAIDDPVHMNDLDPSFLDEPLVLAGEPPSCDETRQFVLTATAAANRPRIALMSAAPDLQRMVAAFQDGVYSVLASDISPEGLVHSLLLMSVGERVFPSRLPSLLSSLPLATRLPADDAMAAEAAARLHLSPREIEILTWLALGEPNKTIATHMDVTESTVRVHMKSILRKLELGNRTQAAIWAIRHGLAGRTGMTWREVDKSDDDRAASFMPVLLASGTD